MTDMNDREKAFETKYALDQEVMFRIEARACKLFGLWLAEKLGIAPGAELRHPAIGTDAIWPCGE